ncbi:hypothetical protein BSKO_00561 [Bryopsis sp. KO-2023]|nr:hypothetical protein BSKO_00561 [Bryopsis sp. KO-2023]
MAPLLSRLKALDAYPKINDDFFKKTLSGGVITLAASLIMVFLFASELRLFLTPKTRHELKVDTSRGETIDINFDITFPGMPCAWMSLDAMDISGEFQFGVDHEIYKSRLGENGKAINEGQKHDMSPPIHEVVPKTAEYCGSCYGAEEESGQCCNTCDDVRSAYKKKGWGFSRPAMIEQCLTEDHEQEVRVQAGEGCRMWGSLKVNRVAGNFHFAPGRSFQRGAVHVHDMQPFKDKNLDFTHTINHLSFGKAYPGIKNPLDGGRMNQVNPENVQGKPGMFQYFLKVVPTIYSDVRDNSIKTNQFSVTEHFHTPQAMSERNLPGVFFFYDLSPIKVYIKEYRESFIHFLTSVCAIIGGVFTMSGLLDGLVYHGHQVLKKKIELGKLN